MFLKSHYSDWKGMPVVAALAILRPKFEDKEFEDKEFKIWNDNGQKCHFHVANYLVL